MDLNGEADDPFREGLVFEDEELRGAPWSLVFSVVKITKRKPARTTLSGLRCWRAARFIDPERTQALRMAIGPQPNAIALVQPVPAALFVCRHLGAGDQSPPLGWSCRFLQPA
jgi:hypothetical protein